MATSFQVERAKMIEDYLKTQEFPRDVASISRELGIPRATVATILNNAAFIGLFMRDPFSGSGWIIRNKELVRNGASELIVKPSEAFNTAQSHQSIDLTPPVRTNANANANANQTSPVEDSNELKVTGFSEEKMKDPKYDLLLTFCENIIKALMRDDVLLLSMIKNPNSQGEKIKTIGLTIGMLRGLMENYTKADKAGMKNIPILKTGQ